LRPLFLFVRRLAHALRRQLEGGVSRTRRLGPAPRGAADVVPVLVQKRLHGRFGAAHRGEVLAVRFETAKGFRGIFDQRLRNRGECVAQGVGQRYFIELPRQLRLAQAGEQLDQRPLPRPEFEEGVVDGAAVLARLPAHVGATDGFLQSFAAERAAALGGE